MRKPVDESKIQKMNRWDVEAELAKCPEGELKRALWQQVWRLTEQGKWSGANLPRHGQVREMTAQNSVRVYRAAPDEVVLQIRMRGSYTMVALTYEEAAELAGRLLITIAKIAKEPS